MSVTGARKARLGLPILCALLLTTAACSTKGPDIAYTSEGIDLDRRAMALREVDVLHAKGQRVWCVPFARNASGVEIRGNADTWWGKARGLYERGKQPVVGAVMAFSATRGMPMGHVAVVSDVVSEREVRVDHANWTHNQVSLGMSVKDISANNDWSSVRVESTPGAYGKPYPISGFIYPSRVN
ncbi:CHAP domain-containing protein [Salipiger sp. P9]|uniref:CHAP domain-containing protein n=1 Tax=Salipiger pentaromativorans TaxID=2943193 RepID=UPI00215722FD|nr:CHAP domain-containing protein [Salipiger pentaromativorans]MCR8546191.1 CHAP domain-containing protein [Salipiger pentaromativorans]